jgi:HD-like signal output (HDOD) protein
MNPPTIERLISRVPASLGSYAPALEEIEAALRSPECSLISVAEAIEKDPDLTSRLLRLGNSSFYGFSSRLATVGEAISLIGIQQVQDLIAVSSIIDQFAGVAPEHVNMESFWRHSLACGLGCRVLATARRMPKADKFFVAGLLHDVGRLVLLSQAPEEAQAVFELYGREPMLLHEAEKRVLGYDHADIGEALLRNWKYPHNLIHAVGYHHRPDRAGSAGPEAAVVHLSDHLVNAMQLGTSGERHVPPLQMTAWDSLRLAPDILSSVVAAIDDQIESVQEVFLTLAVKATGDE